MAPQRPAVVICALMAFGLLLVVVLVAPWADDGSRSDRVVEVYRRQMGFSAEEAKIARQEALDAAAEICDVEPGELEDFLGSWTSSYEDVLELADAGCPKVADSLRRSRPELPPDDGDAADAVPRAQLDDYRQVATGRMLDLTWAAHTAEIDGAVCVTIIEVGQAGPRVPLFPLDRSVTPEEAVCLGGRNATEPRSGYLQLISFQAFQGGVNGVWGIADPEVTQIDFVLRDETVSVTPDHGVIAFDTTSSGDTYRLRVHRGTEVLECEPAAALRDLDTRCS